MSFEWEELNFIEHYLYHHKDYESPTSFWKFSAFATIGVVLRDNVYKRMGSRKIYPNFYILALADSSLHRKGLPVETSEEFCREIANSKVFSGRASAQALVAELAKTETDKKTGRVIKGGSAAFYAPELSAGLVMDPAATAIITDIYDCKPTYDSILKTQARATISNLVFTFYAASNNDMLKKIYGEGETRGGLIARTLLITPDEWRQANSWSKVNDEYYKTFIEPSKKALIEKLRKISNLSGEMVFDEEAAEYFDSWYIPFRDSQKDTTDKTGMVGRVHVNSQKLAIVFAANENKMIISKRHIEKAIDECMKLAPNYNKLSVASATKTPNEVMAMFLEAMLKNQNHSITEKQFFQAHIMEVIDPHIFETIVVHLEKGEIIQSVFQSVNGNGASAGKSFKLTKKGIQILRS